MAEINKNIDLTKRINKFFSGKGQTELIYFKPLKMPIHTNSNTFHVKCKDVKCPICNYLKPKTKWQKIKERFTKLWKQFNRL